MLSKEEVKKALDYIFIEKNFKKAISMCSNFNQYVQIFSSINKLENDKYIYNHLKEHYYEEIDNLE